MIHDTKRVEMLRNRAKAEVERVSRLQARICKGESPELTLAENQIGDIEDFFLSQLSIETRTPQEEALWLNFAERMLGIWFIRLNAIEEQFNRYGTAHIEIIGGD